MEAGPLTESAEQTQALAAAKTAAQGDGGEPVVLGGRYQLTERIASGGMAAVWCAYDDVLARSVAVKLLHDHLAADEAFRERFRREAIAAAKLTHPHVVSLYDTGSDGDRVYLVMEYVDGATLREVIADLGTLEPGHAAAVGEKVARALDYAHERGLVHRDVKPANILLGDDGSVKVADFGIAKAEENDGDLTKTGVVLGTAAYVAPEQITGDAQVDGRADQYALGCMLYEALTGRQPFKGETAVATAAQRLESNPVPLRSLRSDLPRGLDSVIMRAMARDPQDRFVSTGALADALAVFADDDTSHTAALPLGAADRGTRAPSAPTPPRAMPVPPPVRPRGESFLRTEGRWLLPVVGLIVVAGGLITAGVLTGWLDPARLPVVGADQPEAVAEEPSPPPAEPIELAEAFAFDPEGDGGENDDQLPLLLDDDPATAWHTELYYNAPDFGGLKDGVGFYLDLNGPHTVTSVELDMASADMDITVLVADEAHPQLEDWTPVGRIRGEALMLDEPVAAGYVLLWLSGSLPADADGYRGTVGGVSVTGVAEENT